MKLIKNSLFITIITLSLFSCSVNKFNKIKTEKEIHLFINKWHEDAKNINFNSYFNSISDDGIYIGTDATENWSKKDFKKFAKPAFDQKQTWNFIPIERNLFFSKNKEIVWFDELLDTWMGICRASGVIEKQDDNWKIKHYLLSVTIPNKEILNVVKLKKEKDSIYMKTAKH